MSETSKTYLWGGRILTTLPTLMFAMSAAMKLTANAEFLKQWAGFGFSPRKP